MHAWPDIFVSVDLGTAFTGVAWTTPKTPIQVINDWPGSGDRGERKLGQIRREFFKIFLDKDTLDAAHQQGLTSATRSTADARQYIVDFLRQVYGHVKETIEMQTGKRLQDGGWANLAVSFLFSVPTTWTNQGIINQFKSIIREAGFGVEGPRHKADVDSTEAEAAAVETLKSTALNFTSGSLFMVVDAGGGTTDLALMRIKSTNTEHPEMSSVAAVKGVGVGASLIDRAFGRLIAQRLAAFLDVQSQLPSNVSTRMRRSHQYKTAKHKFGERVYTQPTYKMQMEGVSHEMNHEGLNIENGRMVFYHAEIQSLFNSQIDGIMAYIQEQLDWLPNNKQTGEVGHIILSGGLGSSAYVRSTLQQKLASLQHPNAKNVVVVPCHVKIPSS